MDHRDDLAHAGVDHDPFVGELVRAGDTQALFVIGDKVRSAVVPLDGSGPWGGIVTAVLVTPAGFMYQVSVQGRDRDSRHYAMELVADEDGLA
jgi:hypothetical protein